MLNENDSDELRQGLAQVEELLGLNRTQTSKTSDDKPFSLPLSAFFAQLPQTPRLRKTEPQKTKPVKPLGISVRFDCKKCGGAFSVKEQHAICKNCRPSNQRFEVKERRKFRKHLNYYDRRYNFVPDFANFEARLQRWSETQKELAKLRAIIKRTEAMLAGFR